MLPSGRGGNNQLFSVNHAQESEEQVMWASKEGNRNGGCLGKTMEMKLVHKAFSLQSEGSALDTGKHRQEGPRESRGSGKRM